LSIGKSQPFARMIKCGDSTLIDKGGDMSLDDISLTKEKKETTTPLKKLRALSSNAQDN
jgi:hypothetical protein